MLDVYFLKEYGELCESMEGGQCLTFECRTDNGLIKNMFIKKPVPWLVDGVQYYDIVTPYGYGGPIVYECTDREALIKDYAESFEQYCRDENIVCEFIRFHPIFRNEKDFTGIYDVIYSRHTVGTNIKDYDDPVAGDFGKSARKEVRKVENNGVTCTVHTNPDNLDVFRKLYEETMDRNHADKKYYFPDSYYEYLTTRMKQHIMLVQAHYQDEIIASELYFITGDILHAHLLGSNQKLLELGGGAILEATAARWGKANNYSYIHHGGGRTSAVDDPLYLYKKKFGKHTEFEFYMGKKIWNPNIYERLVDIRKAEKTPIEDETFFPAYRG